MKTITVRGLEGRLAQRLKQVAKDEGKSVNQVVLDIIRQRLGMAKKKKFSIVYHDMDELFGRWTDEQFNQIQGKIDSERKIDKELWQ